MEPREVVQGSVVVIRVEAPPKWTVTAVASGFSLPLAQEGNRRWGILGLDPMSPLGPKTVEVQARSPEGQVLRRSLTYTVVGGDFEVERVYLPPQAEALLGTTAQAEERAFVRSIFSPFQPQKLWTGLFAAPLSAPVSSSFGTRRAWGAEPVSGYHEGIDFAADAGASVRASASGVVVLARSLEVRGNAVIIDHGMGVYTGYYHLSEIQVKEGARVAKGQEVGRVGGTGLATGPHLHWEMRVGGIFVDPREWTRRDIGA